MRQEQLLQKYWRGKSVLITGASSGLGWAITEALAPYGVHFGLLSRREDKMRELTEKLRDSGSSFWLRACDVRDRQAVEQAVRDFHAEAGRLDVAWINSGVGSDSSYRKWDWEQVEAMLDTNLKGAIYTTRACVEHMAPQGHGAIVGVASAASMRGLPRHGIYSLTKIGLAYFLESLAAELPQIQVTIIHPGYVDTPINAGNPYRYWLMQPERAAQLMITAVAKRKPVYIFPWQMRLLYHLVRLVPSGLYRKLGAKMFKGNR